MATRLGNLTVRRVNQAAGGDHFLEGDVGDHVGEVARPDLLLHAVVGLPTGGHHHRPGPQLGAPPVDVQVDVEATGLAFDVADRRGGVDGDPGILVDGGHQPVDLDRFEVPVRGVGGEELGEAGRPSPQGGLLLHEVDLVAGAVPASRAVVIPATPPPTTRSEVITSRSSRSGLRVQRVLVIPMWT